MVEQLVVWLSTLDEAWTVFFLSMIPITELRVAIPLGIVQGLEPLACFCYAVLGNFVPIMPALLFWPFFFRLLGKIRPLQKPLERILARFRRRGKQVARYGWIGLALFVAVPLPGTGIWSGTIVAFLFGVPFWRATLAITLGEIIAGVVVTLATVGVGAVAKLVYGFEILVLLLLMIFFVYLICKKRKH